MGGVHKLSARKVSTAHVPGRLSDGAGLYLYVKKTGRKSWIYMWKKDGVRREMGLGGYPGVSLAKARLKAQIQRELISDGVDPLAARAKEKRLPKVKTFGEAADHLVETLKADWSSEKYRQQWKRTVSHYCEPIRSLRVDKVDTDDVMRVLKPIWSTKEETARRLRSRVERILDYATAHGWREGENPARWKGHLKDLLPKRDSAKKNNFAAMPYEEIPEFVRSLREQEGSSALALEFTIHTAARTNEALGATWDEIDFDKAIWSTPASRMKGKQEHIVPLTPQSLEVLQKAYQMKISDYVFPGGERERPLSNMSMNMLMRRMGIENATVHGFRSSFRDWCGDKTDYAREVAEAALAHKIGNKVEQAYRRRHALEKRQGLMADWSEYCCS
jgi:integrase